MAKQRCLHMTASVTMFVIRFLGYFPYYYDKQTCQFKTKWFLLLYPIVFVTLLCFALYSIFDTFFDEDSRVQMFTETSNVVISIYTLAGFAILLYNYLGQYFHFAGLLGVAKDATNALQFADLNIELVDWTTLQKYWFKCIIIPIFSLYLNNIRLLRLSKHASYRYVEFIIVDIGFLVAETLSILHHALLLCTYQTFVAINKKLGAIMTDAYRINVMYSSRSECSSRMQQFCDLSDRLDHVAEMHYVCSSVAARLQRIFSGSVTIWIMSKKVSLIAHWFLMFVFTIHWQKVPSDLLWYGGLLSGLFLFEVFMLVKECTRATNEVTIYIYYIILVK